MEVQANSSSRPDLTIGELLRIGVRHKLAISATTILVTTIAIAISLLTPNSYTATASLLPSSVQSGGSLSSLIGSFGNLGSLAGQFGLQGDDAGTRLATVLESRTLSEAIITKLNLKPVLFHESWDEKLNQWKQPPFGNEKSKAELEPSMQSAIKVVKKNLEIRHDKRMGLILLSFTSHDPEIAATVVNTYAEELDSFVRNDAMSNAKRNRIFIEEQLVSVKAEMAESEEYLKNFQQKNRIISPQVQGDSSVRAYADLKARLLAAEVELKVLEKSTFAGDPRTELKRQEVAEYEKQLVKIEDGNSQGPALSFKQAPEIGLTYARLKRDLVIHEKVFELLTQQYEMAKLKEAEETISFQVLDPAVPPEKKSGPFRSLIVLSAFFGSFFMALVGATIIERGGTSHLGIRPERV